MSMKKILLIEDRVTRQEFFLEKIAINLEEYSDILDNAIDDRYEEVKEQIVHDSFNFGNYDFIISHKSAFENDNALILSKLQHYAKESHKTLIFFSGGISVNYYNNSEFESLELNSETFYSNNLLLFLNSVRAGNENILMLSYGENWKFNIISNVLEKTNLYLEQHGDKKTVYSRFDIYTDINKLSKIDYAFHDIQTENGWVSGLEIEKFKESLFRFFQENKQCQANKHDSKTLLIHNDNVAECSFENEMIFSNQEDIDTYISSEIIPELASRAFNKIFIKDNLSTNYLELYGLRVAYHIRLSQSLGDKRFVPIVIISEYDSDTLMRFTQDANILFTDGIYLCKNSKEEIEHFKSLHIKGLPQECYEDFLNTITIEMPKDTTGSHGIANEWSIYRWAECLHVKSEPITQNLAEIENILYFKYLKARYLRQNDRNEEIKKPSKKGKVLLIDDEWSKGWGDLCKNALTTDSVQLTVLEYDYKDKKYTFIKRAIENKIKEFDPDVVILDLRLAQNDHDNDAIENYTGIKILQEIHKINAGIQVIMFTATSKSTILEKLYEKRILGYIKKEHPSDVSLDTEKNIDKLVTLVDKGLERKYLKEIFLTMKKAKTILDQDIFLQYGIEREKYEPFWIKLQVEVEAIFDILDGSSKNQLLYAMVSIASSLETILTIFVSDELNQNNFFWDGELCSANSLNEKLKRLFHYKFGFPQTTKLGHPNKEIDMSTLIQRRNDYLHTRKVVRVTSEEIKSWFNKLRRMIEFIQSPPKLK